MAKRAQNLRDRGVTPQLGTAGCWRNRATGSAAWRAVRVIPSVSAGMLFRRQRLLARLMEMRSLAGIVGRHGRASIKCLAPAAARLGAALDDESSPSAWLQAQAKPTQFRIPHHSRTRE